MSTLDKIMNGAVRSLTLDQRLEVAEEVERLRAALRIAVTAMDYVPADEDVIEAAMIRIQDLGFRLTMWSDRTCGECGEIKNVCTCGPAWRNVR